MGFIWTLIALIGVFALVAAGWFAYKRENSSAIIALVLAVAIFVLLLVAGPVG